jgi:hypothetical protein
MKNHKTDDCMMGGWDSEDIHLLAFIIKTTS